MGEKAHPYSFREARRRLAPQGEAVTHGLRSLSHLVLPGNEAVIGLTLHPSYLAKSYYPANFLKECGLRHMGSRAVHIRPEKLVTQKSLQDDRPLLAPLIYVAGDVDEIASFADGIADWTPDDQNAAEDFRKIEKLALPGPDRLKPLPSALEAREGVLPLEIVLHVGENGSDYILDGFREFASSLNVEIIDEYTRQVGGLAFLAARGDRDDLQPLLDFTFLRALRGMPALKQFEPSLRSFGPSFRARLPDADAIAPDLAVAIFDGGLPTNHGLERWVTLHEPAGIGAPVHGGPEHGLAVTSAFLFGPLEELDLPSPPPANVDHWRVVGADSRADDFAMLPVLERIENVLSSRSYDFVNISLGPDVPIEDDDITSWTSTIDALLADGETVATVACGNNGEADRSAGLHRVQPPSDGVNVVSVGAATRPDGLWQRASYSACGPGRSPGFVKPDLIAFGGSVSSPFLVLDGAQPRNGTGVQGTSFAAPLVMRCATGVRAQFAEHLWAPTVKALLIHHSEAGSHPREEVGWGCLPHGVGDLVLCREGEAHVIYQRQMPVQGSVRMELPVPQDLSGRVEIQGTFCIYSDVDPEDALNYTTGGLEIAFRPDSVNLPPPYVKDGRVIHPSVPKASRFFSSENLYSDEVARRDDAHKWETVFTRTKRFNSTSLNRPVFDVSYSARSHGHVGGRSPHMKIALVLSIRQAKTGDLYDRVVRAAAGRLQPMRARPGLSVPARVRV
jgi:hypothetical protein